MQTRKLAVSAVVSAVSLLCLFGAGILPTGRLILFAMSAGALCIIVCECGRKYGLMAGITVAALGFLFVPNKLLCAVFAGVCAYYPVLKSVIEARTGGWTHWLWKAVYFLLAAFFAGMILKSMNAPAKLAWYLYPAAVAAGLVYDYALSLILAVYLRRIRGKR